MWDNANSGLSFILRNKQQGDHCHQRKVERLRKTTPGNRNHSSPHIDEILKFSPSNFIRLYDPFSEEQKGNDKMEDWFGCVVFEEFMRWIGAEDKAKAKAQLKRLS